MLKTIIMSILTIVAFVCFFVSIIRLSIYTKAKYSSDESIIKKKRNSFEIGLRICIQNTILFFVIFIESLFLLSLVI